MPTTLPPYYKFKTKKTKKEVIKEDNTFEQKVKKVCDEIANLLIEKNKCYGNAALDPIKCFSKLDSTEQILVRIDDKLSRIMRGKEFPGDDTIKDLIGYLVLLKVSKDK